MGKLQVCYVGRRNYEVTAETKDGKTVTKFFKEPFYQEPKKCATRIELLVQELIAENVEINENILSNKIKQAASYVGRDFPNLLIK